MSKFVIFTDKATYDRLSALPPSDEFWRTLDRALLKEGGSSYSLSWTAQPILDLTERVDAA